MTTATQCGALSDKRHVMDNINALITPLLTVNPAILLGVGNPAPFYWVHPGVCGGVNGFGAEGSAVDVPSATAPLTVRRLGADFKRKAPEYSTPEA